MHHQIRRIRTRVIVLVLLIVLMFPSLLVCASPANETVSLSTGDIDLILGVKVKLTCNLQVEMSPSIYTIKPGKTSTWYIKINTPGTVSLSVYIPSPVYEWYSASKDLSSIASTLYIPIVSGLSATMKINPSAYLTIDGPGSLSISSVFFDYMGSSKSFTVSSHSSASNKARITVDADFELDLSVGLSINLFLFSQQIASTNIGKFDMSPTVSESITVSDPYDPLTGFITTPLFIFSAFVITSVAAMAIVARRNRKKQERRVRQISATKRVKKLIPTPPTRRPVHCIYCGERLPSHALYCRKCGRKVE